MIKQPPKKPSEVEKSAPGAAPEQPQPSAGTVRTDVPQTSAVSKLSGDEVQTLGDAELTRGNSVKFTGEERGSCR